MDWLDLFWFALGALLLAGTEFCGKGSWNDEASSLRQTTMLKGAAALGVAFHHIAQKTCASWNPGRYIVHGLDVFLNTGYIFVAVFFFCSGLGLYKSLKTKPGYLKGFLRRRVLPLIVAYYLSEVLYLLLRLAMGVRMSVPDVLWYLTGLRLANGNAWFLVVIPFFYLAFWLSFRFCRKDGTALFWVFAWTLLYTVGCTFINRQNTWWFRGEWWYNSVLLFPLGMLFARLEPSLARFFRKYYLICLPASAAGVFFSLRFSARVLARWGYADSRNPVRILHRLGSAGSQWLVCAAVLLLLYLLLMKIRFGNRVLHWYGTLSLDFYLMHGAFIELFGYSFMDLTDSLVYIRSVPLFLLAVLSSGTAAAVAFRFLRLRILRGNTAGPSRVLAFLKAKKRWAGLAAAALLLAGMLLAPELFKRDDKRWETNGIIIDVPEGFARASSDKNHVVWEYRGKDKKTASLILSATVRGQKAEVFCRIEEFLDSADWLKDAEVYVNPNGIRMVRGYSLEYGSAFERRYYIETAGPLILLAVNENEAYYDVADCEECIQKAADSVRLSGGG